VSGFEDGLDPVPCRPAFSEKRTGGRPWRMASPAAAGIVRSDDLMTDRWRHRLLLQSANDQTAAYAPNQRLQPERSKL